MDRALKVISIQIDYTTAEGLKYYVKMEENILILVMDFQLEIVHILAMQDLFGDVKAVKKIIPLCTIKTLLQNKKMPFIFLSFFKNRLKEKNELKENNNLQ